MTRLLKVYDKHPKDYGILLPPNWERLAWEVMERELDDTKRYVKHFVETEWEDTSDVDGFYKFRDSECPSADIPYGNLRYYVVIYYEERSQYLVDNFELPTSP